MISIIKKLENFSCLFKVMYKSIISGVWKVDDLISRLSSFFLKLHQSVSMQTFIMVFILQGEFCGGKCAATRDCTNFVWTRKDGGTCFLKNGNASKEAAVPLLNSPGSVCGIVPKTSKVSGPSFVMTAELILISSTQLWGQVCQTFMLILIYKCLDVIDTRTGASSAISLEMILEVFKLQDQTVEMLVRELQNVHTLRGRNGMAAHAFSKREL